MALKSKNCPNCGAPVNGNHCEYCGSCFGYDGNTEIPSLSQAQNKDRHSALKYTAYVLNNERSMRHFNAEKGIWEYVAEERPNGNDQM